MSGVLTELSAVGAQDQYLTVAPEVTFFKGLYRRHTNFATEPIVQQFQSTVDFSKEVVATISRNGDLVKEIWLRISLGKLTDVGSYYVEEVGHAVISEVSVEIGGHLFDRALGDSMACMEELFAKPGKELGESIGKFGGHIDRLRTFSQTGRYTSSDTTVQRLFVPLPFWFCRHTSQALPLIALQYHEVKVKVSFRSKDNVVNGEELVVATREAGASLDADLFVNYVFLDDEERRAFAQNEHEYLIEQLQYTGEESVSSTTVDVTLTFNHPVQELIWRYQTTEATQAKQWFNFANVDANGLQDDPLKTARLQLNGHDRIADQDAIFWRDVMPRAAHSKVPNRYIYCMPFGLSPEDYKPNGSVNLSRIDSVKLKTVLKAALYNTTAILSNMTPNSSAAYPSAPSTNGAVRVYARSRNIVRITAGMAGLKYAN